MSAPDPNPFAQFAFAAVEKPKKPSLPRPKPGAQYQSLTFLTFVIQGVYLLLGILLVVALSNHLSLYGQLQQVKKDQALLESPPAGTDQFQLRLAHDRLKSGALALQQTGDLLMASVAAMLGFSGILGLAFTGWTYKATTNLLALGVAKLVYSPLISALGMFLVPLLTGVPILNEIAKGSDPARLTPYGHREQGVSLLVVAWWLAMVLGNGGSYFLLWKMLPKDLQIASAQPPPQFLLIMVSVTCIISYLLGIWLVGSIYNNQLARLEVAQNPPARPAVAVTPEFG